MRIFIQYLLFAGCFLIACRAISQQSALMELHDATTPSGWVTQWDMSGSATTWYGVFWSGSDVTKLYPVHCLQLRNYYYDAERTEIYIQIILWGCCLNLSHG